MTTDLVTPDELDQDSTVSFWLKRNWRIAFERDPLDATRDAAALLQLCQTREARIMECVDGE
jgi:hypothetical protein